MDILLTSILKLLVLVWKMRKAQNAFYRNGRRQDDLIQAKQLERMVDQELSRALKFEKGEPVAMALPDETSEKQEPAQKRLL